MSFYLMHRGWMENPAFRNEPFNRRNAFEWLVENAAFKDGVRVALPKGDITLKRGQLTYSTRYLARAWQWSEPRVRRCLKLLESRSIIELESDAGQTVITICNYVQYQDIPKATDAETDAAATQDRRSSDANKKEGNTLKESIMGENYVFRGNIIRLKEPDYERWKQSYPAIPDLRAELTAADDYYSENPTKEWFFKVSNWLKRANAQYLDGKKLPAHQMSDAEYNRLHNDYVTADPTGGPQ